MANPTLLSQRCTSKLISGETMIKPASLAYSHTAGSSAAFKPTSRTCMEPGTGRREVAPACGIDFRRRAISCGWHGHKLTLTVSGEGNTRLQIFASEVREIIENFFLRH